ncbi:MAG: hypothetical protein ACREA4_00095 [Nitrososphaera sp.]
MRAMYFLHRSAKEDPEECATRAEKYLSRLEVLEPLEPAIREQLIAFAKSQKFLSTRPTWDPSNSYIEILRKLRKTGISSERAFEPLMQATIYGGLENFLGREKGAFSYVHELVHNSSIMSHSGGVIDKLSKQAHKTMDRLTTEELSSEQIADQWAQFVKINNKIFYLVKKFEPIEEIIATYIGMRLLPTEVRNAVATSVQEALRAEDWYTAYTSFAGACDNCQVFTPRTAAFTIFEFVC